MAITVGGLLTPVLLSGPLSATRTIGDEGDDDGWDDRRALFPTRTIRRWESGRRRLGGTGGGVIRCGWWWTMLIMTQSTKILGLTIPTHLHAPPRLTIPFTRKSDWLNIATRLDPSNSRTTAKTWLTLPRWAHQGPRPHSPDEYDPIPSVPSSGPDNIMTHGTDLNSPGATTTFSVDDNKAFDAEDPTHVVMRVSYQNRSVALTVSPTETLLAAMERHQVARTLALPTLPSDCRRGNCLTCAAKLIIEPTTCNTATPSRTADGDGDDDQDPPLPSTSLPPWIQMDDGLAPPVSRWIQQQGYILTCCSRVQGPGGVLHLQLHQNQEAWQHVYRERLQEAETQPAAQAALARLLRQRAERHVDQWIQQTEQAWQLASSSPQPPPGLDLPP